MTEGWIEFFLNDEHSLNTNCPFDVIFDKNSIFYIKDNILNAFSTIILTFGKSVMDLISIF